MMPILFAAAITGLLINLLYVLVVIAVLGCVVWAVNTYIAPIPQPVLVVLAIIVVILSAVWLLTPMGL